MNTRILMSILVLNTTGLAQPELTDIKGLEKAEDWILYECVFDYYDFEISMVSIDGQYYTRLITEDNGLIGEPVFSPDGSKIAFAGGPIPSAGVEREIYIINVDGSDLKRLTNNDDMDEQPVFSPDGSKIAFHSYVGSEPGIFIINADGTGLTRLNNTYTSSGAVAPQFSPEGSKILFCGGANRYSTDLEIYIMNLDGSGQVQLTKSPEREHSEINNYDAVFSPDGLKVAFCRSYRPYSFNFDAYTSGIFIMNSDGSEIKRLTSNDLYATNPVFSPDGSKILFSGQNEYLSEVDIYIMNADGSGQTQLARAGEHGGNVGPVFSPDGSKIAFESFVTYSNGTYGSELYLMDTDGSDLIQLTDIGPNKGFYSLAFSPVRVGSTLYSTYGYIIEN